jgi:probable F420-dependent oxidoreductase
VKIDAVMKGGPGEAPAEAAALRASGYDGIWASELTHDPFLHVARAVSGGPSDDAADAADTDFGTSIAVAFSRSPMTVAYSAWDLQALTGGRFYLGLGSQVKAHIERRFSMPWSRPAARMREYVLALRAIWTSWQGGGKLGFDGEFYRHTLMTPMFSPGPLAAGPPKIQIAAVGDAMTRVAGEVADGLIAHSFTTRRYIQEVTLPTVREGLARGGRDGTGFDLVYAPFVVTGANEKAIAESAAVARERIAFYASTPSYRGVLELHGWGGLQAELNAMTKLGKWREMGGLITDEILAEFAVIAPLDELPAAYARWTDGVADRTSFTPPEGLDNQAAADLITAVRAAIGELHNHSAERPVASA